MKVEIICVGTELLLGDILNTNARFLSQEMAEMGFNVFSQSTVGDNAERLENQIKLSLSRSDIVILSGGLGPTEDDITKETVAKVLNLPLEQDEKTLENIKAYFNRVGRVMSENNKKQALKIKGSVLLDNIHGTAPGAFVELPNGAIILLPGPPSELIPMFNNEVVPKLKRFSNSTIYSRNVRLFGIGESAAAEACGELLNGSNPTVATYAKTGEVDIRVTASAQNLLDAKSLCEPVVEELVGVFGNHVYGVDVENLQQKVVETLKEKNLKLATAESCTAGMLSERITEVPGSSEVFEMGVVAYANYVKVQALGVDQAVINEKGAVSDEVAAQMAIGIRMLCGADIGVGITGVAGPGQSENKPAGLVYIALADYKNVYVRKILSRGTDRDTTRILATSTALDMVRRYLEGSDDLLSFGTRHGEPINLMEGYEGVKSVAASSVLPDEEEKTELQKTVQDISEPVPDLFLTSNEEENTKKAEMLDASDDNGITFLLDDEYYLRDVKDFAHQSQAVSKTVTTKKKNRFLSAFIPAKGDSAFEKIRKTIFLIASLVLICTTIYLVNYFIEGWSAQNKINSVAQIWDAEDSMQKNENDEFIGFETLKKKNSDIRAWIKIEGTKVNNPVYQTTNNDFYLDHDMDKQKSRYGAIFIDEAAKVEKDYNSQNIVVYGHHMKDGSMFASLKKYTDISYYKKHPIINFTTLYREGKYKIFGVFIINTLEEHDNGYVFNYRKHNFDDQEEFLEFIHEVKLRSIIDTGVEVSENDEILTLSTCTYEFEEARLVVMARRVHDDEVNVEHTGTAKTNKNPLYPQIWYDVKGGKKPNLGNLNGGSIGSDLTTDDFGNTSSFEQQEGVSSEFVDGTISGTEPPSDIEAGNSNISGSTPQTNPSNTGNNSQNTTSAPTQNTTSNPPAEPPEDTSSETPEEPPEDSSDAPAEDATSTEGEDVTTSEQ
ncbi:MAG: competence/damage-inducible protein A [Clostridia bacterium]|nr:competence/damage-inducible protein A [Clostridia bacterium]